MSNLIVEKVRTHPLFRRDPPLSTPWEIIGWWESRRPVYNLIVGIAGVTTLILMATAGMISEMKSGTQFGLPVLAVVGVAAFAVAANFCYTAGWFVEIVLARMSNRSWPDFGPVALALGVAFSVLVTLAPGIVAGVVILFKFFRGSAG